MLIQSKFDSYCRRCGKPIFKGDLIEYNTDTKKVFCIVCKGNDEKISNCEHRAVKQHTYSFTSSNRYKYSSYGNRDRGIYCLICGKLTTIDRRKTMYVQTTTEYQHGRSYYKGFGIDSYIQYGEDEMNSPDLESLRYLYEIVASKNIDDNIKNYAENHIRRICDNLNIENEINLYKKESIIRDTLITHKSIYNKSLLNKTHKRENIRSGIYELSRGWDLNSDIGLSFLEIYNWVVLEQSAIFKSNISTLICGLEMYAIYYLWITEDKNIRGRIQLIHDNYVNDSILIENVLTELNIICDLEKDFQLRQKIIDIFNYAHESYIVEPNFKFGVIRPMYNEEYVTEFYSRYIKKK